MKKILLVLSLLIISITGKAQSTGLTTYTCSIANLNSALYSSFVIDNTTGTKWMGFNSGLTGTHPSPQLLRFNGTAWDTFPHVPSRKVNALAIDPAHNVWIGTDSGLVKFDGITFTSFNTTNSGISSNKVVSVTCGGGNIYAGTYSGLAVFNGSSFTNYNHANNGLLHDTIFSLTYEGPTSLWIGNADGLEKFDGSTFTSFGLGSVGNSKVNCIYVDASNNKWLGTNTLGVVKFDNVNFFTMQQLYGPRPVQSGYAPFLYWPVSSSSITQGDNGGACFFGGNSAGSAGAASGLIEVAGTSVYTYNVLTGGSSGNYMLAFDNNSGFLYAGIRTSSLAQPFLLHKFDKNSYQDLNHTDLIYLDINEVRARMLGNSDFAWDLTNPEYSVPKNQNSNTLFAASMWMGGYHNGSLKMAAMTYRQNGLDFWPGPLDTLSDSTNTQVGIVNPKTPSWNPVWKINRFDVANFIYNWNAGNVQNGSYIPPANFLTWPGNGTGNYAHNLAPYVDVNANGIYDPIHDGDYPLIKGDQMLWWIFNDNANKHTETGGGAFGAEIQASAYAFVCPGIADSNQVLNYTTFHNYKIINRSSNKYDSTVLGLWMDTDLGNYQDDYIGCDVMNNYGYVYNGDNYDEDFGGFTGYHDKLPAFSCGILSGPQGDVGDMRDNNNNGIIDEPNEKCMMNHFGNYTNTGDAQTGNPSINQPQQYYNFISSKWKNGTPITFGSNGTVSAGAICNHLYPGASDPYGISMGGSIANPVAPPVNYGSTGWTQPAAGVVKNDMRFLIGVGPFTMQPKQTYELDYALIFTPSNSADNLTALPLAQQDNIRVKRWFDNNSFPSCLSLNGVGIQKNETAQLDVKVYPNPANNYLFIEFKDAKEKTTVEIYDILGNIVNGAIFNESSKYITIPVENLQSGVYSIRIKSGNSFTVKKFVKE
ncbi:MAG: Periplasmic ligand-binding sensor domain-containing protein [Bacteroidia bacterium]